MQQPHHRHHPHHHHHHHHDTDNSNSTFTPDPNYQYHHPYPSIYNRPNNHNHNNPDQPPLHCPHCRSPPTRFRTDPSSADLICTSCGAVLDSSLRDPHAEWRDFNTADDVARGNGAGKKARCGDGNSNVVDETKWVGGLMPTTLSGGVFLGSGAGAGTSEERYRLSLVRRGLKRAHVRMELMMEMQERRRMREVVLRGEVRERRIARGEMVMMDGEEEGEDGVDCMEGAENVVTRGGDYDTIVARRKQQQQQQQLLLSRRNNNPEQQHEQQQYQALKNKKWSLTDAILLHGSLDQVQQFVDGHHRRANLNLATANNDHHDVNDNEWTPSSHQNEQTYLHKKLDATTRSCMQKLYMAFTLLHHASNILELNSGGGGGGSGGAPFRMASGWLVKFAEVKDGLRVKGISSSGSGISNGGSGSNGGGGGEGSSSSSSLCLSLLPLHHHQHGGASLSTELQRIRQYASLGAAILYLSAKHAGVGRTLSEVCSAFGTFSIVASSASWSSSSAPITTTNGNGNGKEGEPLVRPKHCSRAMQELRSALPEVMVPGGESSTFNTSLLVSSLEQPSSSSLVAVGDSASASASIVPIKVESSLDTTLKNLTTVSSSSLTSSSPMVSTPVKSESIPSPNRNNSSTITVANIEEAALLDLTSRMARSLNLPPGAAATAMAVAVRCARDAATHSSTQAARSHTTTMTSSNTKTRFNARRTTANARNFPSSKGNTRLSNLFAGRHSNHNNQRNVTKQHETPEVIAIASLLLISMAGGTMQRLARQALAKLAADQASDTLDHGTEVISNAMDDLENDLALLNDSSHPAPLDADPSKVSGDVIGSSSSTTPPKCTSTTTSIKNNNNEQATLASWTEWNIQPSWHRDVSQMEQSTGVSRKIIISYYSNVIHPRRSYFLGVAKQTLEEGDGAECFLHNIVAASPLMTLRGL